MTYMPTPKEKEIMNFILMYQKTKKRSPSYKEIAFGVKLKGTNSINNYLYRLKDNGYVYFIPAKQRTVQIIKELDND